MNDIVETNGAPLAPSPSPFGKLALSNSVNHGAVAVESERAIAEARGQIQIAKMFPRSVSGAITEFLDACKSPEFAEKAFYSVPNRGSGPSIRFTEEAARCYGNFEYGHRELSRMNGTKEVPGRSEVEVYAWDKEKNNFSRRQITVVHTVDTKYGPKILTDQTDIDNRIANVASKQQRGRILALLPKAMVQAGDAECKRTIAGGNEKPLSQRIIAMANAFSRFGVSDTILSKYLGHAVDNTTIDELADLMGIYNALKDGAKASEYFNLHDDAEKTGASITEQAKLGTAQGKAADGKATQSSTPAAAEKAGARKGKPAESESKQAKETAAESEQKGGDETPREQAAQQRATPPSDSDQAEDDVF